jgi:hydroxymethylpyrimidine/phosphomethylpyrimidine kinase
MTERALSIAGVDPSAGAGLAVDAFAFAVLGYAPAVATTTVTAQNSESFIDARPIDPTTLRAQLEAVHADGGIACVKVGVVGSTANAGVISRFLERSSDVPAVFDPVLFSSTGGRLYECAHPEEVLPELAPHVTLVSPNAAEAQALTGVTVDSLESACEAAAVLADRWERAVVVTGVRPDGPGSTHAIDVLEEGSGTCELVHSLVEGVGDVRGTGCLFSSACAAGLGRSLDLVGAIRYAQGFVGAAVERAAGLGKGRFQVDLARLVADGPTVREITESTDREDGSG